MKTIRRGTHTGTLAVAVWMLALGGCQPSHAPVDGPQANSVSTQQTESTVRRSGRLSMLIDGESWRFETEVFGAFHPPGYHQALLISGTQGGKDAEERTFNISLYGIPGPGTYRVQSGNAERHVAQIGNLSREEFLAGNMMPFDLTVVVEEAQSNPTRIRATFSGFIDTNTERQLKIEQGVFDYAE